MMVRMVTLCYRRIAGPHTAVVIVAVVVDDADCAFRPDCLGSVLG